MVSDAFYGSPHDAFIGQVPWVIREEIYSGCYMESGRFRSLDIQNTYPRLDPDPRRNLPTSSRVPVRRVVVQSGPGRVGTQSGDNYSAGRYPDVPPSVMILITVSGQLRQKFPSIFIMGSPINIQKIPFLFQHFVP